MATVNNMSPYSIAAEVLLNASRNLNIRRAHRHIEDEIPGQVDTNMYMVDEVLIPRHEVMAANANDLLDIAENA